VERGLHVKWVTEEEAIIKECSFGDCNESFDSANENTPQQNSGGAPTPGLYSGNPVSTAPPVVLRTHLRSAIPAIPFPIFQQAQSPAAAGNQQPPQMESVSPPAEPEFVAPIPIKRPACPNKASNIANDAAILAGMGKGHREKNKKKLSIDQAPSATTKGKKVRMPCLHPASHAPPPPPHTREADSLTCRCCYGSHTRGRLTRPST
jgi:hypothetical protein